MTQYPFLRESGRFAAPRSEECAACTSPATHWLRIAVKEGREHDEKTRVCGRHEVIAKADFDRLLSHIESKAEFIRDPGALAEQVRNKRRREEGRLQRRGKITR